MLSRTSMARVAEVMVERLIAAGVRRIYGVVGDSLNAFTEALPKQEHITWVGVRHEEAAAFAAGAEAHLTGSLAVCAGTSGQATCTSSTGSTTATGVVCPSLPSLRRSSREIGGGYFQETRPDILFRDCSVYCEAVTQPEQMPRLLDIAIRSADRTARRRGPHGCQARHRVQARRRQHRPVALAPSSPRGFAPQMPTSRSLARLLERGRRITILAGAGCAGAHESSSRLARTLKGADRPCDAREGVRRIRQSVRRQA